MQNYLQVFSSIDMNLVIPVIENGLHVSEEILKKVNEHMHNTKDEIQIKKQIAEAKCLLSLLYLFRETR